MTLFTGGPAGAEVNMWLSDEEGTMNGAQLEVAQRIADSLPIVKTKAADYLGSGLIDQSQKMTVAARATAEKKAFGHRS